MDSCRTIIVLLLVNLRDRTLAAKAMEKMIVEDISPKEAVDIWKS